METRLPARVRGAASLLALAVAAAATLATTSVAAPSVSFASTTTSLDLDPGHGAAFQQFVVHVDADAMAGQPQIQASVVLDSLDGPAHLIVTTTRPEQPGDATSVPGSTGAPEPWEADVAAGYGGTALPVACSSQGPCERSFWIVAQMDAMSEQTVQASWHVEVDLVYGFDAYPSGPGGRVDVEPFIQVAGRAPQLVASTTPESVTVGPERPVVARLVEVRLGAAAIRGDATPVGAMTFGSSASDGSGSGYRYGWQYMLTMYPVPEAGTAGVEPAAPVVSGTDPFTTCRPDVACVRRFLAVLRWLQGGAVTMNWQVSVRRVGLARAWATPAELSVRTVRTFDVADGMRPQVFHAEGDAAANDASPLRFSLSSATESSDPLARFLPVPGSVRFQVRLAGPEASATAGPSGQAFVTAEYPRQVPGADAQYGSGFDGGTAAVMANAFAGCVVGEACPQLLAGANVYARDAPSGWSPQFHWTLDVTVYSFEGIPITAQMTGAGT